MPKPSHPRTSDRGPLPLSGMRLAGALVIALAGLIGWHNSFSVPFLFDDRSAITDNPSIHRLWPISAALSPPLTAAGAVGRPLVNLTLAVNYALGGTDPRGYHALNLALHVLSCLLLFGLIWRTLACRNLLACSAASGPAGGDSISPESRFPFGPTSFAFAAALLWTVHPLQTESVTCVIQRSELLAGLFYLLTLYGFVRGAEPPRFDSSRRKEVETSSLVTSAAAGRKTWLVISWLACLLGMAAKEVMVSAPLLVFLYDRTFVAGSFGGAWRRRRAYYLSLGATWLLLWYLVAQNAQRGGTVGLGLGVSPWHYLLTQCRAIVLYLKLSFWPHPLVFDYGTGIITSLADVWQQALVPLALIGLTVWAVIRKPPCGFLGVWFFAVLAPSSSVVPLITQTMAEHRMYLPLAAVIVLVAAVLSRLAAAGSAVVRRLAMVLFLVSVPALLALTVRRNRDYRSETAIWQDTIAKWPGNARAHTNLGTTLSDAGRYGDAVPYFETAVKLNPEDATARCNLGTALARSGRRAEARVQLEEALRLRPDFAKAHLNLALTLAELGEVSEAIGHYESAARLQPDNVDIWFNWGLTLLQAGHVAEAVSSLGEAVRLAPGDAQARAVLDDARRLLPGSPGGRSSP